MRKPFLDNLRYGIVLSVVAYHVFYQFNSVGVITNVVIPGIPALDAPLYVLYPWFMAALFMISGICARYSLEKQTGKQYLKGKVRRQLIPSIAIIFLIGWSTGWVTDQYANIFGGGQVPGFAKYLVWCMSGIGVLWFLHELLLCEVVLVLIRKLDKKDRLWQLGGKANFPVICLLVLGMWGSAYILNIGLEQPLYFQFLNRQLRVASRSCTRGTTMNLDGTTTQQPTEFQQRWTNEHWMLQYDLMFGKGYALNRMGVAGLSGMNTGK